MAVPAGSLCRRCSSTPPTCPVTVIAARGDPLFPLAYIREVYARIAAPHKDLLVLDSEVHLCSTKTFPPSCHRCWSGSGR